MTNRVQDRLLLRQVLLLSLQVSDLGLQGLVGSFLRRGLVLQGRGLTATWLNEQHHADDQNHNGDECRSNSPLTRLSHYLLAFCVNRPDLASSVTVTEALKVTRFFASAPVDFVALVK